MSFLRSVAPAALIWTAILATAAPAAQQPAPVPSNLGEEEIRQFLLTAKVVQIRRTPKGITSPYKLTLSNGKWSHDAAFQAIDERKTRMDFATGRSELNFRDSYHFNIAAYELAKLLGLEDMMPVTVERKWNGMTGSMCWWLDVQMDEVDRMKRKIEPPDVDAWNRQMHRMRVFTELALDTDRNLTNVLISPSWKLYMIDFSRAFRLFHDLENPKNLVRCDRALLERLRKLDAAELQARARGHLNKMECTAVLKRRDKIVAHFEKLAEQLGERAVFY